MDELNPFPNGPQKEAFASLLWTVIPAPDVHKSIREFVQCYVQWVEIIYCSPLEASQREMLLEKAAIMLTLAVSEFTIVPT